MDNALLTMHLVSFINRKIHGSGHTRKAVPVRESGLGFDSDWLIDRY